MSARRLPMSLQPTFGKIMSSGCLVLLLIAVCMLMKTRVNGVEQVIFLGVGEAYKAALHILNSRAYERLSCWKGSVCFASNSPVYAIHEEFFSQLGKYYHRRSKVFINSEHPVWHPEHRRPSKKFGKLTKSPHQSLGMMMWEHREEVEEFIRNSVDMSRYKHVRARDNGLKKEKLESGDMEDTIMVASAP